MHDNVFTNEIEMAAYHQAGHAVAALYYQVAFGQITLDPDGRLGEFFLERCTLAGWESLSKEQREAELTLILAGELAERKAKNGKRRTGPESAWVLDVLGNLEGSEEIARACFRYVELKTQALLDQPYVWEVTRKIACQLLEKQELAFVELNQIWHREDINPRRRAGREAVKAASLEDGQRMGIPCVSC